MQSIKIGSTTERSAVMLPESNIQMTRDAAEWWNKVQNASKARQKASRYPFISFSGGPFETTARERKDYKISFEIVGRTSDCCTSRSNNGTKTKKDLEEWLFPTSKTWSLYWVAALWLKKQKSAAKKLLHPNLTQQTSLTQTWERFCEVAKYLEWWFIFDQRAKLVSARSEKVDSSVLKCLWNSPSVSSFP